MDSRTLTLGLVGALALAGAVRAHGSPNARSKAFGPRLPLGLGKLTYRVKRDTNDNLLIGVYDGATRIAHIDGYWEYSMRGAEDRQEEVETRGRGIACAKDLRALGAEGKYPNLLAVHHAFLDDASRKGQGIGRAMYEALFREALNVRASRIGGSPGPLFVMPHACTSVGSTSGDALRVWQSLAKRYPSSGVVVRFDAEPARGSAARTVALPTESIPKHTRLYHGTSAEERFEEDGGTPDGPAWFSNRASVASEFARNWHEGQGRGRDARVLVYEVTRAIPKIATIRTRPAFDRVLTRIGLDSETVEAGMEEIRDAMGSQRGLNGWRIYDNYQPGDDILLVDPSAYLKLVRVERA